MIFTIPEQLATSIYINEAGLIVMDQSNSDSAGDIDSIIVQPVYIDKLIEALIKLRDSIKTGDK